MSETVRSSLKAAAKGTTVVFAGMIASQALWFVVRLLIVRSLPKEDLGNYTLVVAIISIISLLATLGLWQGTARYISIFSGQGRKKDADAVHRSSLIIGAVAGTAACVLMFLFSDLLSRYVFYKPELSQPFMVISFFIPAYVMAMVSASVLRGYGNINPSVYFIEIGQPFFLLALLCLIFLLRLSFLSILYAYVCSMALSCVLIGYSAYRKTGTGSFHAAGDTYIGELLKFSAPVLSIDAMFLLFRWVDALMLGRYGTAGEVGVYSVGVSLAVFLNLPLVALGFVYLPIAGDLYAKNRSSDLERTYQVLTKWVFAVTMPIFFILFFFPETTVNFLFGDRFEDSILPLRILSLGYLLTTFMGPNNLLLLVFGLSKALIRVSAAGILLDILLNYLLIKHFGLGIKGASLATSVSLIAVSFGYSFVLYRHCRIHPLSSKYLKPALGSAIIGIVIYAAAKNLPLYFWMLPVYFLFYICGYFALLVYTRSIDAEDVFLFGEILSRSGIAPKFTKKMMAKLHKESA